MAETTWTQSAGMVSDEDTDNIESYSEQAEASKDAAAVSAAAAEAAKVAAAASEAAALASKNSAATSATTATTGAATATTKASEAAASAASAATSATAAQTAQTAAEAAETAAAASEAGVDADRVAAEAAATAAAASETAAATSETNAATSATASATSATAASASETAAASSATAAAASETAAGVSETNAATSATTATTKASEASASATAAASSETNALSYVADTEAARDQSQDARDTANLHKLAAEAAATSATNTAAALTGFDLDAIAESKAVTAVDVFVYDTSKDSDGGAWRKRTQGTSWYNETLNTATRGSRREFPAVAVIVAEAAKVTIYDGDDPALPMWMVFNNPTQDAATYSITALGGQVGTVGPVGAMNGEVFVSGTGGYGSQCALRWSFTSDRFGNHAVASVWSGWTSGNIASRNALSPVAALTLPAIVNSTVNDVAMTVLPDAPIDPATGLPVPTIAVATAGGVSVIKDDGTVVSKSSSISSYSAHNICNKMVFNPDNTLFFGVWNGATPFAAVVYDAGLTTKIAEYGLYTSNSGADLDVVRGYYIRAIESGAIGTAVGLHLSKENRAGVSKSLLALITSTYNTGWMNGDIKGAFLADTDDTDLVGSGELVTNGTFDTDVSGWSAGNGATLAAVSGKLRVTNDGASYGYAYQAFSTVIGKTYKVSVDITHNAAFARLLIANVPIATSSGNVNTSSSGLYTFTFVATAATTYVNVGNRDDAGIYNEFDNISVKLADADRSVNNNGLIVNGTVTRTPVATGAELVAYSGLSASNYLEQPYNPDLDFGTGDFCVMGWVKGATVMSTTSILARCSSGTDGFQVWKDTTSSTSAARFRIGSTIITGTTRILDNFFHVAALRQSGTAYLYVNGVLEASGAAAASVSGSFVTQVGWSTFNPFIGSLDGIALLRIGATAPSPDQIRRIYEDEKVLFQENAACTLYGASDAVTALAHDPDTDLLHVGTSAGRSVFKGLRRVANTTTPVGTSISASNGLVVEE